MQQQECFHEQIKIKLKGETSEVLHLEHSIVWWLSLDAWENRLEIPGKLKCGAGEGWRISVGPIV